MSVWIFVAAAATVLGDVPARLECAAQQTVGLHDYPHNAEAYEAVEFFESRFTVEVNQALTQHLAGTTPVDVYVTLRQDDDKELVELDCVRVRGQGDVPGLSCTNNPPAQLLLINLANLRFTRTAIGGWTFAAADEASAGESIFVEYGVCQSD